jgi:8-oxo-dGTP pyrophosphatase MutT (NUDIX family)
MEELGIRVKSSRYLETLITSPATIGDQIKCTLYVVTEWSGTLENRQPEEHSAIQWVPFEEALSLDLAAPEYTRIIDEFAKASLVRGRLI